MQDQPSGDEQNKPQRGPRPGVPPRVWPGCLIVALLWVLISAPIRLAPGWDLKFPLMIYGGMAGAFSLVIWWMFASRTPWRDRWIGLFMLVAAILLGRLVLFHPSLCSDPLVVLLYVQPVIFTVVIAAMALTASQGWRVCRFWSVVALVAALAGWCSVRSDGLNGYIFAKLAPRWTESAEDRFLAERKAGGADPSAPAANDSAAAPPTLSEGDWPAFRGPQRDGTARGVAISKDWEKNPPRELWRRLVGPGWSSFCAIGDFVFTQEQRDTEEVVVCYRADTGDEVWVNAVKTRFEESIAGAGPRSTPTFYEGDLYTTGANGEVQRIDARTGKSAWKRNLLEDTGLAAPREWGFASSPLIVEGTAGPLALVFAGNPKPAPGTPPDAEPSSEGVVAYDINSGQMVWRHGVGDHSYSSPHLTTLGGVPQVLMSTNFGLESLSPTTGERLWFYAWSMADFARIVQPMVVDDSTVVLAAGYGYGAHGIKVTNSESVWKTETLWQSKELKPYYNDLVLFQGYLYGFDGPFLKCLDPKTGESLWPRRSQRQTEFGHGQAVLVEDSGVLIVTTEETGEVVLVGLDPKSPQILARLPCIEGKNWNHPVLAHGRLFIRNGSEAVCYQLALEDQPTFEEIKQPTETPDGAQQPNQ